MSDTGPKGPFLLRLNVWPPRLTNPPLPHFLTAPKSRRAFPADSLSSHIAEQPVVPFLARARKNRMSLENEPGIDSTNRLALLGALSDPLFALFAWFAANPFPKKQTRALPILTIFCKFGFVRQNHPD